MAALNILFALALLEASNVEKPTGQTITLLMLMEFVAKYINPFMLSVEVLS